MPWNRSFLTNGNPALFLILTVISQHFITAVAFANPSKFHILHKDYSLFILKSMTNPQNAEKPESNDNCFQFFRFLFGDSVKARPTQDEKNIRDCALSHEIRIDKEDDWPLIEDGHWNNIEKVHIYQKIHETRNRYIKELQKTKDPHLHHSFAEIYKREWIPAQKLEHDTSNVFKSASKDRTTFEIKMLQFNVLAEGLSAGPAVKTPFKLTEPDNPEMKGTFGGFTSIPMPEISLNFNLRRWRILEVMLGKVYREEGSDVAKEGNFDLIALQEVDRYHGFFKPALQIFGYESVFVPKRNSPCMGFGWYSDGCVLCWKQDTFELLCEERGYFKRGSQNYIVATLRHVSSGRVMVVSTTHLKAKNTAAFEEMRREQVNELAEKVEAARCRIVEKMNIAKEEVPIVLMGDFNAELKTPQGFSGPGAIRSLLERQQSPRLSSAYDVESDPELYTTWKTRGEDTVRRTIDFIFYNVNDVGPDTMRCTHTLGHVDQDEMEETALPGFKYPSDHLAIGAKFIISKFM